MISFLTSRDSEESRRLAKLRKFFDSQGHKFKDPQGAYNILASTVSGNYHLDQVLSEKSSLPLGAEFEGSAWLGCVRDELYGVQENAEHYLPANMVNGVMRLLKGKIERVGFGVGLSYSQNVFGEALAK